jgi:hypothetical protein
VDQGTPGLMTCDAPRRDRRAADYGSFMLVPAMPRCCANSRGYAGRWPPTR